MGSFSSRPDSSNLAHQSVRSLKEITSPGVVRNHYCPGVGGDSKPDSPEKTVWKWGKKTIDLNFVREGMFFVGS